MITRLFKRLFKQIRISLGIEEMKADMHIATRVAIESYLKRELRENPRYQNTKRLNAFENQVFSQFGEDGIIAEIFTRIGTTNKFFIEIGSADGIENNTTNLLIGGWKGIWIDGDENLVASAQKTFHAFVTAGKIKIIRKLVTTANIASIFTAAKTHKEFDLLSIDIDGNDYWVWKALKAFRPRVVVIEYNASLGPTTEWVMKYDPRHEYDLTNYHGASLKSLEVLGKKLGYRLVGCSFAGVNAFFVRQDLAKNIFFSPPTAASLYESPKHFLYHRPGHPMNNKIFKDFLIR